MKKSSHINAEQLADQYLVRKARSKDVRTEAISYLIRNRTVLNSELDFNGTVNKKFNASLIDKTPATPDQKIMPISETNKKH